MISGKPVFRATAVVLSTKWGNSFLIWWISPGSNFNVTHKPRKATDAWVMLYLVHIHILYIFRSLHEIYFNESAVFNSPGNVLRESRGGWEKGKLFMRRRKKIGASISLWQWKTFLTTGLLCKFWFKEKKIIIVQCLEKQYQKTTEQHNHYFFRAQHFVFPLVAYTYWNTFSFIITILWCVSIF